jgi:two-component system response regulator FixJ
MSWAMPADVLIHVIDDDEAIRESLAFLFASAELSARTYGSALDFLRHADPGRRECVVTDVRMPDVSGIDLLRELSARKLAPRVIIMTGQGDLPLALEAMKLGAFDFLEKPFRDEDLLDSVGRALAPRTSQTVSAEQAEARARFSTLSERERQVLAGLVDANATGTIAGRLGIHPRAVEVYRARLMSKMEARSFAELVRMTLLIGDIGPCG